jgi:hypothetical protein
MTFIISTDPSIAKYTKFEAIQKSNATSPEHEYPDCVKTGARILS